MMPTIKVYYQKSANIAKTNNSVVGKQAKKPLVQNSYIISTIKIYYRKPTNIGEARNLFVGKQTKKLQQKRAT